MSRGKKKGALSKVNTEGWMMSYADMATILLAMFIVLTVLGQDQTGVSLHKGLESYRESRDSFGLSGMFESSPRSVQFDAPTTRFPSGADGESGSAGRSLDAELERLQHFVHEMDRQFPIDKLPPARAQATVDLFDPIHKESPYLASKHREVLGQVLPLLKRGDYRVTLVVWATMPSDSAWLRAAEQANHVADEAADTAQLEAKDRARFTALGQPWRYPDYQRPVLSISVTKTQ